MSVRKVDMSHWTANTRRYETLEQAMDFAQLYLERTKLVSIWPLGRAWMVIIFTPAMAN